MLDKSHHNCAIKLGNDESSGCCRFLCFSCFVYPLIATNLSAYNTCMLHERFTVAVYTLKLWFVSLYHCATTISEYGLLNQLPSLLLERCKWFLYLFYFYGMHCTIRFVTLYYSTGTWYLVWGLLETALRKTRMTARLTKRLGYATHGGASSLSLTRSLTPNKARLHRLRFCQHATLEGCAWCEAFIGKMVPVRL